MLLHFTEYTILFSLALIQHFKRIVSTKSLRPINLRKLLGKPLQLPLSLELCYLKNSISDKFTSIHILTSFLCKLIL
jgi:hypothetical protein